MLLWKLLYSGSTQTTTQSRLPFSSAWTANHYVKHSHHGTLEPHPSVSNHNWARYHTPHTTFMRVSGHQWIISWRSTFARPHKQNLPTSLDFDWSTADTKPQRWCTNRLTPLWTSPVAKGSSSLYWPWNWLRVHHVSKQSTHYNIGFLNAQWEMLFANMYLGTTKAHWSSLSTSLTTRPGDVIVFARKTLVDLDA